MSARVLITSIHTYIDQWSSTYSVIRLVHSIISLTSIRHLRQLFNPLGELLDAIISLDHRGRPGHKLGVKVPAKMTELAKSYHDR